MVTGWCDGEVADLGASARSRHVIPEERVRGCVPYQRLHLLEESRALDGVSLYLALCPKGIDRRIVKARPVGHAGRDVANAAEAEDSSLIQRVVGVCVDQSHLVGRRGAAGSRHDSRSRRSVVEWLEVDGYADRLEVVLDDRGCADEDRIIAICEQGGSEPLLVSSRLQQILRLSGIVWPWLAVRIDILTDAQGGGHWCRIAVERALDNGCLVNSIVDRLANLDILEPGLAGVGLVHHHHDAALECLGHQIDVLAGAKVLSGGDGQVDRGVNLAGLEFQRLGVGVPHDHEVDAVKIRLWLVPVVGITHEVSHRARLPALEHKGTGAQRHLHQPVLADAVEVRLRVHQDGGHVR